MNHLELEPRGINKKKVNFQSFENLRFSNFPLDMDAKHRGINRLKILHQKTFDYLFQKQSQYSLMRFDKLNFYKN